MDIQVTALGAFAGLVIAIGLILKKVSPAYGMIAGALLGGLLGGAGLAGTVEIMMEGAKGIIPAVIRILTAGVLVGVLLESGAAGVIAETIVKKLGEKRALLALALAAMILTAIGVFITVAVITTAPIALAIAHRANLSKPGILVAMVGGGKAGNLISPNPNTIAAANAFDVPLTSVMAAGIIPAVFGILAAYLVAGRLAGRGSFVRIQEVKSGKNHEQPGFTAAIAAPLVTIFLLALRPLFGFEIDPLIALPAGGIAGAVLMGKARHINEYATSGLAKMSGVAIMLLGTGALAGVIGNSAVKDVVIAALTASGMPAYVLAPVSGAFMSMATASTAAATVVAGNVFSTTLLDLGVSALAGAAMIHAGATVFDHLPHGGFFHASAGSVHMDIKERLKLLPYESLIGLVLAAVSMLIYGVFGFFG
ncbi:GntP family permease [Bacillus marinisedimentorum]|uniref:GntP family permease n=1 Tax=Bacillus marinisedimentorum TaxID=1821260 RepID=UPI000872EECC|nr:SLC13 family permease [Bacillus marinisedimentorum]